MGKLTEAGIARYMQYHVMRAVHSTGQVKGEIYWSD